MNPKQGFIPALFKSFAVTVVFAPTKPNNYYRRFFVLVGDALPLFYDCLGEIYLGFGSRMIILSEITCEMVQVPGSLGRRAR